MRYYALTPNGLNIKDFDLRHTVESAQPITFHADYDFSKGTIDYASGNRLINASFSGSDDCNVRFMSNKKFATKDFVERFRLNDNMAKIYSDIATDDFM